MIGNIIFMCTGILGWVYGLYLNKSGSTGLGMSLVTLNTASFALNTFALIQDIGK